MNDGLAKPMPKYATREEWLVALVEALRPIFGDSGLGLEIPAVRVSCSWPSKSIRKRLGECWHSKAAKDGSRSIFITPLMDDGPEVAAVMVHELLHAALPDGAGHKAPFKKGMKALGLEGKATATNAGPDLAKRLHAICKTLGEYPHAALTLKDAPDKKQGTRMLKLTCKECGYVVRTTAKWIDQGLPTCACGGEFAQEEK
jgi:hypothetical protein